MKYTTQENVRIVVSLLKEYNIHYIVIDPGGTNIPVVQAVQDDPFFHCYSVVDERSAMYFAIGLYLQTGEPVATSCTSAQATRNYIPGLTEAFYKHVPILAITTAKLERFQYQEYMQAPDQCSLPRDCVKASYDLPPVVDKNTRALCEQRSREAMLEIMHGGNGPVQLNIRIDDSLQNVFDTPSLPSVRVVKRYMLWDDWSDIHFENKRILIVVGEHRPFSDKENAAIDNFVRSHNVVVYVNHLSNFNGYHSIHANLLVSVNGLTHELMKPDLIVTIGGQTGDYSIYGAISNSNISAEVWRVAEDGKVVDTYGKLTKVFECPFDSFFNRVSDIEKFPSSDYYQNWSNLDASLSSDIDLPLSNLFAAQQLSKAIPENSIMNFAILNSLRCWNFFKLKTSVQCYSNVAAFGIDGCTSTLIGESMNTESLCFLITGDLAFFYDMNALGIRHIKNNVRILLINNNVGGEFHIMTNSWPDKPNLDPYISAAGHNGTAKGWAETCGFKYLSASTKKEFIDNKSLFLSEATDKPILYEIFSTADDEPLVVNLLMKANRFQTSSIKSKVKDFIGPSNINRIKKILKK